MRRATGASYVWVMVAGTERLMDRLRRRGPLCGDVGGLLFFVFWMTRARQHSLPLGLGTVVDLATVALVLVALLGYQLAQASAPAGWLGWAGVATVALGFSGSLAMVAAGLMLFGASIVRCGVHPRLPGWLLVGAGWVLVLGVALAPGFGRAWANLSPVWSAVMGAALVVVAAALADLDVIERAEARERGQEHASALR
jgi:hypothetical protein